MYAHKIPGYLEKEDTFVWHLTMRQCVIIGIGLTIAYPLFSTIFNALPNTMAGITLGLVAALPLGAATLALALLNIWERGLDEWGLVLLLYAIQPHLYLWSFVRPNERTQSVQEHEDVASSREDEMIW